MGWTNSHLYKFQFGETEYGEPDPDNELYELDFQNSRRAKLDRLVAKKGSTFLYEYDFGDGWTHELVLQDILRSESASRLPVCLAGERACPPEDCGGTHGYADLLGIISNPDNEQYSDMMTWLGGQFYPASFDVEKVNRHLTAMRLK